jgi:ABC-type amino acid transport substrate-binding protein
LNKEVGSKFSPQIRFVLRPVDSVSIFTAVESGLVDFVFPITQVFSCIDSEFGLMPLALIRRSYTIKGQNYVLNRYGGVMVTRANSSGIISMKDLKGKIIVSANMLTSQFQWKVFVDSGLNFLQDPAQIRFLPTSANQIQVIWDVLNGNADVGFAREIVLNDPSLLAYQSQLKVINLMPDLLTDDGHPWPFPVGTFIITPLRASLAFSRFLAAPTLPRHAF